MPRGPYVRGDILHIGSPSRLAEELQAVVDKRFGGDAERAARAARISPATFRGYLRGRTRNLRRAAFVQLRKFLKERPRAWAEIVIGERDMPVHAAYHAWLAVSRRRLQEDSDFEQAVFSRLGWGPPHTREEELEAVISRAWKLCPHVKTAIERLERTHETERLLLARIRIVEPLVQAAESGFVERHWTELSDGQFRRFVDAGWKREKILLDRLPAYARIATRPRILIAYGVPRKPFKRKKRSLA